MSILVIIDSPTILVLALPYAITRVALKDKRGRIYGCIVCFIFWQLASFLLLVPSVSLLFWHIFPLTLETYILLATIQTIDLIVQIHFLPEGGSGQLSK